MNLSQNTALIRVNLSANNNLSSLTIGRMQNLEQLWVQNTSLSTVNIRNCPIIAEAYRSGNKHYFSWGVGYGLDGFNLGGGREVDLCNFCLGSSVSVTA